MDLSPEVRELIQHIIDEGAPKLIEQGRKARGKMTCFYRTASGDKCLIGQCISDADYRKEIEGRHACHSDVLHIFGFSKGLRGAEQIALRRLQGTHDSAEADDFVASFSQRLSDYCITYGFTLPDAVKAHVGASQ